MVYKTFSLIVLPTAICALVAGGLPAAESPSPAGPAPKLQIAPGPFQPTWQSLKQYQCPEWFRDAKFGIWAHWGPQAVPMCGDWYAREMYIQGSADYKYHVEHYGHPSKFGFKDVIALWKAERWDPERLMALYKKAGAKYFVSMGSHCDNFYMWDSKIHRWNAAAMGPRRDVVGQWQRAAKRQGLRFGVSEHFGYTYAWFQTSHGADKTGPLAGVPYDGADPAFEDLYCLPCKQNGCVYTTDPRSQRMWFDAMKELVDGYKPDLVYTDGGVPFGIFGRSLVAHLYNSRATDGRTDAVYTCKDIGSGEFRAGTCVQDMERGVLPGINPHPWQTDTSIGDWFYKHREGFRPTSWCVHMLADIVSKNGNLLLNIVQRPDGSLDPIVEQRLGELAAWIAVSGEAIYGTRPWQVYGEGAVRAKGGHFQEDFAYTAKDIRFTTKGPTLYAIALGWPAGGKLRIRSLAKAADGVNAIGSITLLGGSGELKYSQDAEALEVTLPAEKPCEYTCTLKITGSNLRAVPVAGAR
jgi:alpha-L-fucosidase